MINTKQEKPIGILAREAKRIFSHVLDRFLLILDLTNIADNRLYEIGY